MSDNARGQEQPRRRWAPSSRDALAGDSPWAEPGFWLVQAVVLGIYLLRLVVEVRLFHAPVPDAPDMSTLGLFIWPVLFAAVNFGPTAGLVTTAWVALSSLPREVAYAHSGNAVGVWSENTQIAALCIIALVVGRRVSAEHVARLRAESAHRAHVSAEARYRRLFEWNAAPILLVERTGTVLEANASALRAFGEVLQGRPRPTLGEILGAGEAGNILGGVNAQSEERGEGLEVTIESGGTLARYRARAGSVAEAGNDALVQIVFNDVTTEARRRESVEGYAASVVHAQEEERRHLAQELHDGPLQAMVHVCRRIDDARRNPMSPEAARELEELRAITGSLIDDLRGISRGLRPSVLDDLGLAAAVRRLAEDLAERSCIDCSAGVTGTEQRLPSSVELALFRVAQEALSNAEKHSGAARVSVGLAYEAPGVRLLVSDDGEGFDQGSAGRIGAVGSLGLRGMRERLHLVGGSLTVHSNPAAGTTVDAWVPTASLTNGGGARLASSSRAR